MMAPEDNGSGLAELERRVRFELDCLGYPARPWTRAGKRDGKMVHDVVIVGGGQSGGHFRLEGGVRLRIDFPSPR